MYYVIVKLDWIRENCNVHGYSLFSRHSKHLWFVERPVTVVTHGPLSPYCVRVFLREYRVEYVKKTYMLPWCNLRTVSLFFFGFFICLYIAISLWNVNPEVTWKRFGLRNILFLLAHLKNHQPLKNKNSIQNWKFPHKLMAESRNVFFAYLIATVMAIN